jgi:hypothetical protein
MECWVNSAKSITPILQHYNSPIESISNLLRLALCTLPRRDRAAANKNFPDRIPSWSFPFLHVGAYRSISSGPARAWIRRGEKYCPRISILGGKNRSPARARGRIRPPEGGRHRHSQKLLGPCGVSAQLESHGTIVPSSNANVLLAKAHIFLLAFNIIGSLSLTCCVTWGSRGWCPILIVTALGAMMVSRR